MITVGPYEFNENGVCMNPDVFFEMQTGKYVECRLEVAQVCDAPELWDCGYHLNLPTSGRGCSASISYGYPSIEHAKSAALFEALNYFSEPARTESGKVGPACNKMYAALRAEFEKLPTPVEPIEISNWETNQYILPLL